MNICEKIKWNNEKKPTMSEMYHVIWMLKPLSRSHAEGLIHQPMSLCFSYSESNPHWYNDFEKGFPRLNHHTRGFIQELFHTSLGISGERKGTFCCACASNKVAVNVSPRCPCHVPLVTANCPFTPSIILKKYILKSYVKIIAITKMKRSKVVFVEEPRRG